MNRTAAEFFAGIGLVRLALEKAGWSVVFANDIDSKKFEMYAAAFGEHEYLVNDIATLTSDAVPDIELATASFPCIDLSLAGSRAGLKGRHSSTYWHFHRLVKGMAERKPRFVLLENVVGLLHSADGEDLRAICSSLNELGYVCDLLLVDAVHFVPQSRPRLFVIGVQGRTDADALLTSPHPTRPAPVISFIRRNNDLAWLLHPVGPLPKRRRTLRDIIDARANTWWESERREHLWSQMSDAHKRLVAGLAKSEEPAYATVYKRVRPSGCRAEVRADGVAGCLRTPRGGSSKQFVIEGHNGRWRVRHMSPREYGALQGISSSFPITVPDNQAMMGFGDAVCVPALAWVIRNTINKHFDLLKEQDHRLVAQAV
ncbi:MAG TPA: DNA (cytosine-5-)-methyltransferase [Terriglobales bacterium]|nr:DNA (cytosine-5-)-methyltransferase [Terriglobales bacterium]